MISLLTIAATVHALSAAEGEQRPPEATSYFGQITIGVERQDFVDGASEEKFWIDGKKESISLIVQQSRTHNPASPLAYAYVSVCGVASQNGAYDHMGLYGRKLVITKVNRVYATRPKEPPIYSCISRR